MTFPPFINVCNYSTGFVVGGIGGFGVTGGAHRMWCHRAYKANLPLRIILMLSYCVAGQVNLQDIIFANKNMLLLRVFFFCHYKNVEHTL